MAQLHEVVYQKNFQVQHTNRYLLAGDIGGTNSNFGIFEMQGAKPVLLFMMHAKSQEITDYVPVVADILFHCKKKYGMTIEEGCFGAAGIVVNNHMLAKPTNLKITVDAHKIIHATALKKLVLINDFEAVALGIEHLKPASIITINKGGSQKHAQQACVGAGTGLGKSALIWSKHHQRYLPIVSEGGHADAAAQTDLESRLFATIRAEPEHGDCPVSWEDLLSGKGIARIYHFLGTEHHYPETASSREIAAHGFQPDFISAYAQQDERCKATFDLYTTLYARCAKNFVLDLLALNGIYIAGGIAAKNIDLFKQKAFFEEFVRCNKHRAILQEVPIFVIADYNVNLYGAIAYIQLRREGIL